MQWSAWSIFTREQHTRLNIGICWADADLISSRITPPPPSFAPASLFHPLSVSAWLDCFHSQHAPVVSVATHPWKRAASFQRWFNAGAASLTPAQHWTSAGPVSLVSQSLSTPGTSPTWGYSHGRLLCQHSLLTLTKWIFMKYLARDVNLYFSYDSPTDIVHFKSSRRL